MGNEIYKKLHATSKKASLLGAVHYLLDWDQETYMPKEAIALRSEQTELVASLVHKEKTSKGFAKLLFSLIDQETGEIIDSNLSIRQVAALKRWRSDYLKEIKLPSAFVKKFAKTTSTASHVWKTARDHNDFKAFAPHLEKIVSLNRKKAELLGFQEHPYDALLDLYEPEMKTSYLLPLFNRLKLFLSEFLKEIKAKPAFPTDFLYADCPADAQRTFAWDLLKLMGFNSGCARLDLSSHPFCSGMQPKDIRMTTRIQPDNIMMNIGAVMHEGGHGLYEMHLPIEEYGSPLGEAVSLGIHESQSRFWETCIGQSESFLRHLLPRLQKAFPEAFGSVSFDAFYGAINNVHPGLIRIDSDEVCYNLHVILRFELEKGLIEGSIKVKDVPELWNAKMREYIGTAPTFDGQGCLQDIHWSLGYFGYFPTYTLGNLYMAQLFETLEKTLPHWKQSASEGNLKPISDFLNEKIHCHGREFLPGELCLKATGKPLSEAPYIAYLENKYRKLYRLT
ncbi:MAG: hypothetical protein RLZZ453_905 [Chlamydiota bacterium]|jgi:carboxypeptidase Taq